MAKNILPTNYTDDIMNSTMGGKRRYRQIQNSDGTISLEDVTDYDRVGSDFGAGNINATNTAVNESADKNRIIDNLEAIASNTQAGYIAGALSVKEVNQSLNQGNLDFDYVANDGLYYNVKVGADTVRKKCNSEISMTNIKAIVHSSVSNAVAQCDMEINVDDYTKLSIGTLSYSDCAYYTANKFVGYKKDGTQINYELNSNNDITDIVKFFLSINAVRKNTTWGVGTLTLSHLKLS